MKHPLPPPEPPQTTEHRIMVLMQRKLLRGLCQSNKTLYGLLYLFKLKHYQPWILLPQMQHTVVEAGLVEITKQGIGVTFPKPLSYQLNGYSCL